MVGYINTLFVANFVQSLAVKEFRKSINVSTWAGCLVIFWHTV